MAVVNQGSFAYVSSSGWLMLVGDSSSPTGSPMYQFFRSSTSAGYAQEPPPSPPPSAPLMSVSVMLVQSLTALPWPTIRT